MFSVYLYLRRNLGKTVLFSTVVAIGVAGSLVLSAVVGSFGDTRARTLSSFTKMIVIRSEGPEDFNIVEKEIGAKEVYESTRLSIGYPLLKTSVSSFPVFGFQQEVIPRVMEYMNVSLSSGRLPRSLGEIVVPQMALHATGYKVGDIWKESHPYLNQGDFIIVGSTVGETLVGFTLLDGKQEDLRYIVALGEDPTSLEELASLTFGADAVTGPSLPLRVKRANYRSYAYISTGMSVCFGFILAIVLSMISSVELRNRRSEIAILSAIGFPSRKLYFRAALEGAIKAVVGWVLGTAIGYLAVDLLLRNTFLPAGMILQLTPERVLPTLSLPATVVVANLLTLSRQMQKDPLACMDKEVV